MRQVILFTIIATLAATTGCGGSGLSQADMRRMAIRRPSTDDSDNPSAARSLPAGSKSDIDADVEISRRPSVAAATSDKATETTTNLQIKNQTEAAPAPPPSRPPAAPTSPKATAAARQLRAQSPAEPLTPEQRRQRTIDNLTEIGAALRRFCDQKGCLFGPAICNTKQQPMLSWRVELLPFLGYQELYDRFDTSQPWDSPHNKPLLELIPPVYQSPERFDTNTNYVVPVASFTPFGRDRGYGLREFEDGLENTLVVVEVDNSDAVPWTKPEDLPIDLKTLRSHVGTLREDGFFVVWGDGSVTRVTDECGAKDLKAILTRDGGESFAADLVRAKATATPAVTNHDQEGREEVAEAAKTDAASGTVSPLARNAPPPATPSEPLGQPPRPERLPVPNPLSQEQARKLIGDIYKNDYEKSKTVRDQRALAQRMLKETSRVSGDPAGQYVLLDIVIKIATQTGDTSTALAAMEKMTSRYEMDDLRMESDILQQLAKKKDRDRALNQALLDKAEPLIDRALKAEQFDVAEGLCQIALGAARQLDDRAKENSLTQQKNLVEEARKAFKAIQRTIASVENAEDPAANLVVGRYYCLVRREWQKGLPLLAKGSDTRLKQLAEAELRQPAIAADQLEVADGWWQLGEEDSPRQKVLRLRAVYWYQRAVKQLPQGLWKIKAEMRVQQVKREYGEQALASLEGVTTG